LGRHVWLLTSIIIAAAALCLYHLGSQYLWFDEALSVTIASSQGGQLIDLAFLREPTASFYYLLLHLWLSVCGDSRVSVRLISVVFAIAALLVVFRLGSRLCDTAVGLTAALIVAVNVTFISYAQEARTYTLTLFLELVSWLLVLRQVDRPSRATAAGYVAVTVMATYSHTLALLNVPAQIGALFLLSSNRELRRYIVVSGAAVAILSLPAVVLVAMSGISDNFSWIQPLSLHQVTSSFASFAGASWGSTVVRRTLEAMYSLALLVGLKTLSTRSSTPKSKAVGALVIGAAIPIVALIGGSLIRPMYVTRYVLISLPFFALIAASGLCYFLPRLLFAAALAAIVAVSLVCDYSYYRAGGKPQDWHKLIAYVSSMTEAGDRIAFVPSYCRMPFDYARRDYGGTSGSLSVVYPLADPPLYYRELTRFPGHGSPDYRRLWVITCERAQASVPLEELEKESGSYSSRKLPGLEAFLFRDVQAADSTTMNISRRTTLSGSH
jgi:mannosyltransferase